MENEIQFLLYSMPDEQGKVQVIVKDGTIWCTQKAMAQLFGVEVNTINYHLKEIYSTKELTEEATIRKIRIVHKRVIEVWSVIEPFILLMLLSPSATVLIPSKQQSFASGQRWC